MRTLRLSLVGTVILALFGGLSGAAMAQDEGAGWATPVSGSRLALSVDDTDMAYSEEAGYQQGRGLVVTETWEWSDPRLPSDAVGNLNFDADLNGQWPGQVIRGAVMLEGPDGYWTGTEIALAAADGTGHGVWLLSGHGDYDGISAVLMLTTDDPDCVECLQAEGFVYEGVMTPMPEPLEPAAE